MRNHNRDVVLYCGGKRHLPKLKSLKSAHIDTRICKFSRHNFQNIIDCFLAYSMMVTKIDEGGTFIKHREFYSSQDSRISFDDFLLRLG